MQLVQSRLLVTHFDESYDFYTAVLGLSPQRGDRNGRYEKLSFPRGDAAIALQTRVDLESEVPLVATDRALIVLRVDNVDELVPELVRRGAKLIAEPALRFGRIRCAYLRDPEGHVIELQTW